MRRYLTLVFMLLLAIPAGISFSGCVRNPAGNYCNGLGYGIKDTDVYKIILQPQTTGISLAWGQEQQIQSPSAFTCKNSPATASGYTYSTTNNKLVDIAPGGKICAGTWNRNSGGGIPDYTICNIPNPLPTTNDLPYVTAFVSASANSVTSNPVQVFVHAAVSSVTLALANNQQCYSQGQPAQLDSEACYASGGQQFELCAPSTLSPANYSCKAPANGQAVPSCSSSIGTMSYAVVTPSVANLNSATNTITAAQPGTTAISASIAGSGASAGYFSTCPPQSISVTLNGATSATVTKGVAQTLQTTVVDTRGQTITGLTLDYQSTNPQDISVGSSGSVLPSFPGAASIYAICQPSTCNPSPINQVGVFGTGLSISSNAVNITTPGTASSYVWFGAPGKSQYVVPYDLVGNTLGSTIRLPYVPNSMVMDQLGTTIYFGSSHALMALTTTNDALIAPNTNVPGVVLAVSPDNKQVLINDQSRRVFYIYNASGATVASQFTGLGSAAEWTPDAKTLYITDSATLGGNHTNTLYVFNANTGWTTYSLPGGGTNLALTIPSVGAYVAGTTETVAHTWCPAGNTNNYAGIQFYPVGDTVSTPTDVLTSTTDGQHMLGAAIAGGGTELSDIKVSIPFNAVSTGSGGSASSVNLPIACPQSGGTMSALEITHPFPTTTTPVDVPATSLNQLVMSPASNLAFLTYDGTTPGGRLPYYLPGNGGAPGSLNYIQLTGGNAVIAPIAGAFSLDNQYFFVSTSGDALIHFVKTSNLQDTQQINPALPACAAGSDPSCAFNTTAPPASGVVPAGVIVVKPRNTV